MKISVSSLSVKQDLFSQIEYIKKIQLAGADLYHIDIIDDSYSENIGFDISNILKIKEFTNLTLDAHLMVKNPFDIAIKLLESGVKMIAFHFESAENIEKMQNLIHSYKGLAGIVIDKDTEVEPILDSLRDFDYIILMSVKAGACGQSFDKSVVEKLKILKKEYSDKLLAVDGGINDKTARYLTDADILMVGNYVASSDSTAESISLLKSI